MIMWFFFFEFVYVMEYIDGFSYIEPSLNPWDEAYLIVVNYLFYVFWDLVGKNLIEYFCTDVHKGNWSEVLFPYLVFGLGISIIVASLNWVVFLVFLFCAIV